MEQQRSDQYDPGEEILPLSALPQGLPEDHPAEPVASRPRWSRWDADTALASDAPAPAPVWTRYIESRLRQFDCEGR